LYLNIGKLPTVQHFEDTNTVFQNKLLSVPAWVYTDWCSGWKNSWHKSSWLSSLQMVSH